MCLSRCQGIMGLWPVSTSLVSVMPHYHSFLQLIAALHCTVCSHIHVFAPIVLSA